MVWAALAEAAPVEEVPVEEVPVEEVPAEVAVEASGPTGKHSSSTRRIR